MLAITGANGYVGQSLIRAALRAGHRVIALSRTQLLRNDVKWQSYALEDDGPLLLPSEVNAVIHLAANTRNSEANGQVELEAVNRLIHAAKSIGAIFLFVSSQTARPDAPTSYGRNKWKIEQIVIASGGLVVRPGMVYGGPEKGLFGLLCNLMRRMPIMPVFVPSPEIQPIHVDDLTHGLLLALEQPPSSLLSLAETCGVKFSIFLRAIAFGRARGNTMRIPIPIPIFMVNILVKMLPLFLVNKFGLTRLRSLFLLNRMETRESLQKINLKLRPLCAGVTRSSTWRRHLILEGALLLNYILRAAPANASIQRYVRAVETFKLGLPLPLPNVILYVPAMLGMLDGGKFFSCEKQQEIDWRFNAALYVSEASPQGAKRFLNIGYPLGVIKVLIMLGLFTLQEVFRRAGQIILSLILSKLKSKMTSKIKGDNVGL